MSCGATLVHGSVEIPAQNSNSTTAAPQHSTTLLQAQHIFKVDTTLVWFSQSLILDTET